MTHCVMSRHFTLNLRRRQPVVWWGKRLSGRGNEVFVAVQQVLDERYRLYADTRVGVRTSRSTEVQGSSVGGAGAGAGEHLWRRLANVHELRDVESARLGGVELVAPVVRGPGPMTLDRS